jgi:hypothetical protein
MSSEKREFAIDVIAFTASHFITYDLFEIEAPTEEDIQFATNLSMHITEYLNFRFPEGTIAWALLQIPDVLRVMNKVLGKQKVAAQRPRPCDSCRDLEYRVRAVFRVRPPSGRCSACGSL